ncbi:uncharacterized protein LY89DRAFT_620153, partial [Mollisia scopiformis]
MLKPYLHLLLLTPASLAITLSYTWDVAYVTASPDGVSRQVIGINGQWPLPTIEGTVGDTVTINLTNSLGTQSTGLHFHGINQKGSPIMDGPSGVSQCPIPPGSSFTYTFELNEPGTYWYHSHNNGQYPDGLRVGPLIVHDPNDPYAGQYDEEIVLTTSDWYHDEIPTLITQLLNTSNTGFNPPIPDALLLNDTTQAKFHFTPGKTYMVRIISMAAFASTLIEFGSHQMQVIAVDGSYVTKTPADQIRVAPAQRYTVLITALNTPSTNYAFLASLDINRDFTNTSAAVYPHNITGYIVYEESQAYPQSLIVDAWTPANDVTFQALSGQSLLANPTKLITLDFTFGIDSAGVPRSYFNNITYVTQKVPSLFTALTTGNESSNPVVYGTVNPFVVAKGDIVQIVVNNFDQAIHPFHLHGHQFQVLERPGSQTGAFSGNDVTFLGNPMQRDTITVNANSYVVLRFEADNPGVWLFHCHIEWHVVMGLIATIVEAPEDLVGGSIPDDHQAACKAQNIPVAGNAAGNTQNPLDLTGANTQPP